MEKTTQDYIADGLIGYKKLAKYSLKSRWKKMDLHERCDAARGLVVMDIVAKEPDCFSKEKTERSWIASAKEYAKKHNFAPEDFMCALYFVQDPKGIVWNQAMPAMRYPLVQQYYHFLDFVQNYEYAKTNWQKERYAQDIEKDSKRINDRVNVIESPFVARIFKEFIRNFYNVR